MITNINEFKKKLIIENVNSFEQIKPMIVDFVSKDLSVFKQFGFTDEQIIELENNSNEDNAELLYELAKDDGQPGLDKLIELISIKESIIHESNLNTLVQANTLLKQYKDGPMLNSIITRLNQDDVDYTNWTDLDIIIYYLENYADED